MLLYNNKKLTKGELLNSSLGQLGRAWDRAISAANAYSCISKVIVGPCGVLATRKWGTLFGFDIMRKWVTPIGPATFKKSLSLFLFFSCHSKNNLLIYWKKLKIQITSKSGHNKVQNRALYSLVIFRRPESPLLQSLRCIFLLLVQIYQKETLCRHTDMHTFEIQVRPPNIEQFLQLS